MPSAFRLARYRFTLQALDPIELPHFAGSTLRGAFGVVLRKLVCVTRMPTCDGCLLRTQCAYGYVFETWPPAGSERLRNLNDIPRPFVIEPEVAQAAPLFLASRRRCKMGGVVGTIEYEACPERPVLPALSAAEGSGVEGS